MHRTCPALENSWNPPDDSTTCRLIALRMKLGTEATCASGATGVKGVFRSVGEMLLAIPACDLAGLHNGFEDNCSG